MARGAEALGTVQTNVGGHQSPVVPVRSAGGQHALLDPDVVLADARQPGRGATHFGTVQQKGGGVDVEATGVDVVFGGLAGQQKALPPAHQWAQHRHLAGGLVVAGLFPGDFKGTLTNAYVTLQVQGPVNLVPGIEATGLKRLPGGGAVAGQWRVQARAGR